MKHNELKAYFKKRVQEVLPKCYDVISVDVDNNTRYIYVIDRSSLLVKLWLDCYFSTKEVHIKLYHILPEHHQNIKDLDIYKDVNVDIKCNYLQLHHIKYVLNKIKEYVYE